MPRIPMLLCENANKSPHRHTADGGFFVSSAQYRENDADGSRTFLDGSRTFLDGSRTFLDGSRTFLDGSRTFLDVKKTSNINVFHSLERIERTE